MVVNCAKDWARTQGRHDGEALELAVEQGAGSTEDVEHHTYLWQLLHKLDDLPEGIKETLLLVHAEGMTHGEAAAVLEVKESTVSWRLHEFRKRYRLAIDEGGFSNG